MLPPIPAEGGSSGDSELEEEKVTKKEKKSKTVKKSARGKGSSKKD